MSKCPYVNFLLAEWHTIYLQCNLLVWLLRNVCVCVCVLVFCFQAECKSSVGTSWTPTVAWLTPVRALCHQLCSILVLHDLMLAMVDAPRPTRTVPQTQQYRTLLFLVSSVIYLLYALTFDLYSYVILVSISWVIGCQDLWMTYTVSDAVWNSTHSLSVSCCFGVTVNVAPVLWFDVVNALQIIYDYGDDTN